MKCTCDALDVLVMHLCNRLLFSFMIAMSVFVVTLPYASDAKIMLKKNARVDFLQCLEACITSAMFVSHISLWVRLCVTQSIIYSWTLRRERRAGFPEHETVLGPWFRTASLCVSLALNSFVWAQIIVTVRLHTYVGTIIGNRKKPSFFLMKWWVTLLLRSRKGENNTLDCCLRR